MKSRVFCTCLLFLIAGCKGQGSSDPPTASASPQASAMPAPLASAPSQNPTTTSTTFSGDAGPPPIPMRADQPAPPDSVPTTREIAGYTIVAALRTDAPPSPRQPDANAQAIESAKKKNEPHLTIDLGASHARMIFGRGLPVAEGAELRARVDRYGYVLLLEPASYRVIAPGAMRALFAERRVDVAPLAPGEVKGGDESGKRLGVTTRRFEVTTRAARATFDIARVADAGESGPVLCRILLDWMGASPSTLLCAPDDVPLHAEFHWTTRGVFVFDAISIVRRLDMAPSDLSTPPAISNFVAGPLPPQGGDVLLTPTELAVLHNGAPDQRDALRLFNSTDILRFVYADGAPIAWVAPGARIDVPSLTKGKYAVEWRTFFADADTPPVITPVPGTSESGVMDAGTP